MSKMKQNISNADTKVTLDDKFETTQDVSGKAASTIKTDSSETDYSIKKSDNMGDSLRQEKVAQVIAPTTIGSSATGIMRAFNGAAVSGNSTSVLAGRQGTPEGSETRENSRYGKKIEKLATKINYTPSEQYIRAYREVTPLAEAKDKVQGGNSNFINDTFRSQKAAGTTPAELVYERSIDILDKDTLYFTEGQLFSNDHTDKYPTKTYNTENRRYESIGGKQIHRRNYINNEFNFQVNKEGEIVRMEFDTMDVTPSYDAEIADKTNANALVFDNVIELQREALDVKAGDEYSANWCPWPRAIPEPNKEMALQHDFESVTGAEVGTAINKMKTALSYYLSRTQKDGMDLVTPAVDAFLGDLYNINNSEALTNEVYSVKDLFDNKSNSDTQYDFEHGSAAAFIPLYDSISKYNNKADIALQPRSLKMHLTTALANSKPLYVNPTFMKAYLKNECFSTIDGIYDPSKPVLMTNKTNLIHPFSFNELGAIRMIPVKNVIELRNEAKIDDAILKAQIGYVNDDKEYDINTLKLNNYLFYDHTKVYSSERYLCYKAYGNDISLKVDINNNNKAVVLYANNFHNGISANNGIDIIIQDTERPGYTCVPITTDYDVYVGYPADEFKRCEYYNYWENRKYDALYAYKDANTQFVSYNKFPLLEGIKRWMESMNGKLYEVYKGHNVCVPVHHSTKSFALWDLILCASVPFITQERVAYSRDLLRCTQLNGYPFTDLVPVDEFINGNFENFTFTSADEPLVLGKLNNVQHVKWIMPEMFWSIRTYADDGFEYATISTPWYMNEHDCESINGELHDKYDEANFSWPSIRAGMKLDELDYLTSLDDRQLRIDLDIITGVGTQLSHPSYVGVYKYGLTTEGQPIFETRTDDFTLKDLISLPRQLGWCMDATIGMITPKMADHIVRNSTELRTYSTVNLEATANMKYPHTATMYAVYSASPSEGILAQDDINITRSANFKQRWYKIEACKSDVQVTDDYGVVLGAGYLFNQGELRAGYSLMSPIADVDNNGPIDEEIDLASTFRGLYDRIQNLPFIISPFDAINVRTGNSSGYDIFNLAYVFGLCGFRAADYTEDMFNRRTEIVNKGLMYTQDAWKRESYLA